MSDKDCPKPTNDQHSASPRLLRMFTNAETPPHAICHPTLCATLQARTAIVRWAGRGSRGSGQQPCTQTAHTRCALYSNTGAGLFV